MSHDASANLVANIGKSALKRPEAMRAVGRHLGERLHHVPEQNRDLHHCRLHPQPHKPQLRQRTSCPPRFVILRKPPVGGRMVDMGRPCQSEQDIDIKQGDGHCYRPGSRNSRAVSRSSLLVAAATSSGPKPGVPAGTCNTGKPLRTPNGVRAATPRRASSDKAAPTETQRATAKALAASKTSFSTSSVVRILIQ